MNLLDEDLLCEFTVIVPKQGQAIMIASKEHPQDVTEAYVKRVASELIACAVNFAGVYGITIGGTFGNQPPPA